MSGHCAHEDQAEGLIGPQWEARQFGRGLVPLSIGLENDGNRGVPFELLGWVVQIVLGRYDEYG